MHDVLGGTNSPTTARPVTGSLGAIYSGQVPFTKPRVGPRQSPAGLAGSATTLFFQQLISEYGLGLGFGTITVIDDVLTAGPELGSQEIGRARGVYVASSVDGTAVMMAFTVVIEGGEYGDSINFYGVYRIRSTTSRLAVVGGTGKFKMVGGFAEVRSLIPPDQRPETLLRIIVHLRHY
ncbi:hypothetical protein TIFTF001_030534 [Ficus carica]|uniref:Dirigent protein n=1 Tax=Ficus carica TaxID=3494 RepID=A0AA88DTU6_FICCA|nr:hypothetical protein TIFTF001_030534 [Ficus carica]